MRGHNWPFRCLDSMLFWDKFQIITSVLFLRVSFLSPLFFTLFATMVRRGIFDFCVKINPKSFETAIGLFWAEWSLTSCANQFFGHLLCLHGSIAFQEPWRPRRGFFCCSKEYQYEVGCGKPGGKIALHLLFGLSLDKGQKSSDQSKQISWQFGSLQTKAFPNLNQPPLKFFWYINTSVPNIKL